MKKVGVRSRVMPDEKLRLLDAQGYKCAYCDTPFGSRLKKGNKPSVIITPELDHLIPWTLCRNMKRENLVVSCNICNGIKSSKLISHKIKDIRAYIAEYWKRYNVRVYVIPDEEDDTEAFWGLP